VAKVGTSKAGSTISQIGCGTSVACHGKPIKEEEEEEEEEDGTERQYSAKSFQNNKLPYSTSIRVNKR
jgi:hypothetical protein